MRGAVWLWRISGRTCISRWPKSSSQRLYPLSGSCCSRLRHHVTMALGIERRSTARRARECSVSPRSRPWYLRPNRCSEPLCRCAYLDANTRESSSLLPHRAVDAFGHISHAHADVALRAVVLRERFNQPPIVVLPEVLVGHAVHQHFLLPEMRWVQVGQVLQAFRDGGIHRQPTRGIRCGSPGELLGCSPCPLMVSHQQSDRSDA